MKHRRWWHLPIAYLLKWLLFLYTRTWRVTYVGRQATEEYLKTSGTLFLLWHDSLLIIPRLAWVAQYQPVDFLISNSRDGDVASELACCYKNVSVVRVKHLARSNALRECCHLLSQKHSVVITPDGPRGPRHEMKPGALFAAKKSNVRPIMITYTASRFFTLSSWDRFMIPLPFAKITILMQQMP